MKKSLKSIKITSIIYYNDLKKSIIIYLELQESRISRISRFMEFHKLQEFQK